MAKDTEMSSAEVEEMIASALAGAIAEQQATRKQLAILVDGETFTMDDLTFGERRELRRLARVAADDAEADLEDLELDYLIVAFYTVCKQRTDPAFDVEDAFEVVLKDVQVPEDVPPTEPAQPPAKPRSGKRAAAAKSTPST